MTRIRSLAPLIITLIAASPLAQAQDADLFKSPDAGGARNFTVTLEWGFLNLREQPSSKAPAVARFRAGAILDNLGCQPGEGGIWCDVQEIGGGPRGFVSVNFLKPAVAPDGSIPTGPDDSASRASWEQFDARGTLPCAMGGGQPMGHCSFDVARAGGGYATVIVKRYDGRNRAIFFRMGRPIGADTSQADGYPALRASKQNDLHMLQIGNERYEIPDAVIFGG